MAWPTQITVINISILLVVWPEQVLRGMFVSLTPGSVPG